MHRETSHRLSYEGGLARATTPTAGLFIRDNRHVLSARELSDIELVPFDLFQVTGDVRDKRGMS
jgi:hypothetical protein